jgi:hypothetical protein
MRDHYEAHEAYPDDADQYLPPTPGPDHTGAGQGYEEVTVAENGNEQVRYVTLVGGKEDPYHGKIYHHKHSSQSHQQRHPPSAGNTHGKGNRVKSRGVSRGVEEHEYTHTTSDTYEYELARDDKGRRAKWEEGRRYVPERRDKVRDQQREERDRVRDRERERERQRESDRDRGYDRDRRGRDAERGREQGARRGEEHIHHHYHGSDHGHGHVHGHPGSGLVHLYHYLFSHLAPSPVNIRAGGADH